MLISAFDSIENRSERIKQDPITAFFCLFNSFIENCQSVYAINNDDFSDTKQTMKENVQ